MESILPNHGPKSKHDENAFLIKKLQRKYEMVDYDGDKFVSREDYITWQEKSAELAGVPFTQANWIRAGSCYDAFFANTKNFDQFSKRFLSKIRDGTITKHNSDGVMSLFNAVDLDGNGVISWSEYRALSMSLGFNEAEAHYGFGMIDTNGDGVISFDEFAHAALMYYTDKSDSKWKHFHGKWKDSQAAHTPLQMEKMRRIYNKFDFNGDGSVEKEDADLWVKEYGERSGTEVSDEMERAMKAWFDAFFGSTKNFNEWKDKFLKMAEQVDFEEKMNKLSLACFKVNDVDNNEVISWNEYRAWVCSLGATEADAHYGFSQIDVNEDGQLSFHEFALAILRYFTDKKDSRFMHTFGRYKQGDNSFLIKKLRRIYNKTDFDENGVVQAKDYVKWAEKVCAFQGVPLTDEVKGYWTTAYETYFGDTRNFGEWRDSIINKTMKVPRLASFHQNLSMPIFKAIDVDGNGGISWNEYRCFVRALGCSEAEAHVGFSAIDSNGDGKLSFEEFAYAEYMYLTDRTDSDYKHFYGEWKE